jgi:hypothetical protein
MRVTLTLRWKRRGREVRVKAKLNLRRRNLFISAFASIAMSRKSKPHKRRRARYWLKVAKRIGTVLANVGLFLAGLAAIGGLLLALWR